jgi:boron transporter
MMVASFLFQLASETTIFNTPARRFLSDYGMPISIAATTGLAYWGRFNTSNPTTLPVGQAFAAAEGRPWLVKFWLLEAKWVGLAFPFGIALFVLFYFDHNVSVRRLRYMAVLAKAH